MAENQRNESAGGYGWLVGFALLSAGMLSGCDPNAEGLCDDIKHAKAALDARLVSATKAGLAQARSRDIEVPNDSAVPENPYTDSGELHPLVKKWAFDGDQRLRGEGPSMSTLGADLTQALEAGKKCPPAKP